MTGVQTDNSGTFAPFNHTSETSPEERTLAHTKNERAMPPRHRPATGQSLPPSRTMRPDTVLLRHELRWTAGTMLTLSATGYSLAGAHGAAIGAGSGFLLQQTAYRLIVHALWHGWMTRSMTFEGHARAKEIAHVSLRAFTLWIRTANTKDRLYIALWNIGADMYDDDLAEVKDSATEIRIRAAYTIVLGLDNVPLRCDNPRRRRLRCSLQRDEERLLHLATGERLQE